MEQLEQRVNKEKWEHKVSRDNAVKLVPKVKKVQLAQMG